MPKKGEKKNLRHFGMKGNAYNETITISVENKWTIKKEKEEWRGERRGRVVYHSVQVQVFDGGEGRTMKADARG